MLAVECGTSEVIVSAADHSLMLPKMHWQRLAAIALSQSPDSFILLTPSPLSS